MFAYLPSPSPIRHESWRPLDLKLELGRYGPARVGLHLL